MAAGLILQNSVEKESVLAFLNDEGIVCETAETNQEIIDIIEEYSPEVLAVNAGVEEGAAEMTQKEEQLKEEGHRFTPASHQKQVSRRLQALQSQLIRQLGHDAPDLIRFDPHITGRELAIHDDDGLESLGIDTSGIKSAEQFDAALGAVTARFYSQNQYTDLGVIVPEALD